jgi:hypothetical protein
MYLSAGKGTRNRFHKSLASLFLPRLTTFRYGVCCEYLRQLRIWRAFCSIVARAVCRTQRSRPEQESPLALGPMPRANGREFLMRRIFVVVSFVVVLIGLLADGLERLGTADQAATLLVAHARIRSE